MDEIVERPKYSRQTGTPRRNGRNTNPDILSTIAAAKMLVVVVFLSVVALCKAAHTPATENFVSKIKEVTTINYDVNKYLLNAANTIGIKLPAGSGQLKKITGALQGNNENNDSDVQTSAAIDKATPDVAGHTTSVDSSTSPSGNTASADGSVNTLGEAEIKDIAEKYSFIHPIKGEIVSPFGTRTDPLTGKPQFHTGIDIEANMGTSIKAALSGEVTEVGSSPEYDKYIKLKHNDGITTLYAHCSILIAKTGQTVNQGDVIAKVGNSEDDSSSNLHFEVWKDNKAIDPGKLFDLQ
ncbi:MAG TPA: M23 family metallopeptidase, partial [Ruminiclostridium sp.]|nr:M23 family metallopeptidase [Ruminiclostridium sp.]